MKQIPPIFTQSPFPNRILMRKKTILELQSELLFLRQENHSLKEENRQMQEKLDYIHSLVFNRIS